MDRLAFITKARKILISMAKWACFILLMAAVLFLWMINLPDPVPKTGVDDYALTKAMVIALVARIKREGCGKIENLSGNDKEAFCEKVCTMNGFIDDKYDDIDSDCVHDLWCTVYFRFEDGIYAKCYFNKKVNAISVAILSGKPR